MIRIGACIIILFILGSNWVQAQKASYSGNPDASFFIARDLAFAGKRQQAQDTLTNILTIYPDYADVRNLLASTLSWDGKFDEARNHFNKITSNQRDNKDAWVGCIKNEIYGKNFYIALGLANKALLNMPEDADISQLRDQVLTSLHTNKASSSSIDSKEILGNKKTDSLEIKVLKNRIGIDNAFEIFDIAYDPMVYSSLEYRRETSAGAIIPRINYSNRFDTNGLQYEIDFYPKFSKTFYGYLNYGYSKAPTYPDHRVGVELYANLPKSMEASVGMRYLAFNDVKATIYTASFGLYRGNYYYSVRPYITPKSKGTPGISAEIVARKYFRDGDNYLGLRGGVGYSPELRQLKSGDELLAETVLFIESERLGLEYQFSGKKNPNIYRTSLAVNRQELVFKSGTFFWAISAGITYQVKF